MKKTVNHFGFISGPSGVGKGYGVGEVLAEYHGVKIFVTGDWCRDQQAHHALNGTLAPDDLIIHAVVNFYEVHKPTKFLVDSPRNLYQAENLIKIFKEWDAEAIIVTAHITVDNEIVCKDRIKHRALAQGRPDDAKKEVIDKRLKFYYGKDGVREKVIPFLIKNTRYRRIDGTQSLENVRDLVRDECGPTLFNT